MMAPAGNSAKALQQNRPRSAVPKIVLPVIPLPYIQKRKQVDAAREKAKEEKKEDSVLVPVDETESSSAVPKLHSTEIPAEEHAETPADLNIETNGVVDNHSGVEAEQLKVESPSSSHTMENEASDHPVTASEASAASIEQQLADEQQFPKSLSIVHSQPSEEPQQTPTSEPSEPRSTTSRLTYQMPPAFVPASSQHGATTSDSNKTNPQYFNSQQFPTHQAHPSASSLMFGGYPDSTTSSPAPPTSAGNAPPYPYPQQAQFSGGGGRHGAHASNGSHSHHMSNGYSPMGPPPPPGYHPRLEGVMNQVNGSDGFARRQMVSFGPPDGYSPSATPFGVENQRHAMYDPTTPHSFHGSQQSSLHNESENPAMYNGYPAIVSNGSNGHIDDVRLYQQPRPKPPPGPLPTGYGVMPLPIVDHLDGLVTYLQTQFGDSTFADYTLELRYSDDRAEPVRIPGHNIIFARSPTLKVLMTAEIQKSNLTPRTLLIESDDRYLRSDGFSMAVQRLYGGSLLDLGAMGNNLYTSVTSHTARPLPGTPADRFDLALGYAAAGHILQMAPIVNRGVDIASHFISWETVEKAFDFALDGGLDNQWTHGDQRDQSRCPSTYGPAVNMLIYSALNFVVSNFPPQFHLDTSVGEPARNRRLPTIEENRPVAHNPLLSRIQFGDHEEETIGSTNPTVILSKLLLNLPYHLLKYILESSRLGNVQGWATAKLRGDVMRAVVEEREKRRTKIKESKMGLNEERRARESEWNVVGWEENVVVVGGGSDQTPSLSKTWVGFEDEEN